VVAARGDTSAVGEVDDTNVASASLLTGLGARRYGGNVELIRRQPGRSARDWPESGRAFDHYRYKERNTVERCFAKLRQFRAVATRYDKREFMYQGTVDLASIRIWLRDPVS
jgi:transposase